MKDFTRTPVKRVNLALQGGGSHGAFSWGVIDRILEDERIEIEAVTGASAGAVNAAALADGIAEGHRDQTRQKLRSLWSAISEAARLSPIARTPCDMVRGDWGLTGSPGYLWFDLLSRLASPYDINPFNFNPLLSLIEKHIDFDRVRNSPLKVYVAATNVETGRAQVFEGKELTAGHIQASACLPHAFQAAIIDGKPYWDGGYMGNPPLWPLFENSVSNDVILIQINPIERKGVPRAARDILDRIDEITFNASLLRELRTVDFVCRLLHAGRLEGTGYRPVYVHTIGDETWLAGLGASSKLNAEKAFLDLLFEKGRAAADCWLEKHFDMIGTGSTVDLQALFQGEEDALDGYRITREAHFRSGTPEPGLQDKDKSVYLARINELLPKLTADERAALISKLEKDQAVHGASE